MGRSKTIAACALGLWGVAGGNAFADWAVHRSGNGLADQGARALAAHPEDDALAGRMARELGRKQFESMVARFERRANDQPGNYGIQLAHAQLLLACGRWEEAARRFGRAADLSPGAVAPRWGRARAFGRGGDARAAVAELRTVLPLARGSDQIKRLATELVIGAAAIGDVDAEVAARRAWVRADPMNRRLGLDLASVLARAGRPAEAAEVLAGMASVTAGSEAERAGWALAEGKARDAAGDLAGASLVLARALRRASAMNSDLRRQIWEAAIDIARRRGTLDELKLAVAHPRDATEWWALAQISDDGGDLAAARIALDAAIRLAPGDLDLRRQRISVAKRVGQTSELVGL